MPAPEGLGYSGLRAHDFDIYDLEIVLLEFEYTYSLHFIFISSTNYALMKAVVGISNRCEIAFIL